MKIPVPDKLPLKQIAEQWAVESELTEEEILDRFSSAFWRSAFEVDLEKSCLFLIQPITTHQGVAMTGSLRFVEDEDRWERQESKIDLAPPTKMWNRRRALVSLRPIQGLTFPPKPELWPADGKPKPLDEIVESTIWDTLASLGLDQFDLNFRNRMKAATVFREDFCQVADRQGWGTPLFWSDVTRADQKGRTDPTVDGPTIETPEQEPDAHPESHPGKVGRPSTREDIIDAYISLRDEDIAVDYSAPLNRVYEQIRTKVGPDRKGFGDEAIRKAITHQFQEDKAQSKRPKPCL